MPLSTSRAAVRNAVRRCRPVVWFHTIAGFACGVMFVVSCLTMKLTSGWDMKSLNLHSQHLCTRSGFPIRGATTTSLSMFQSNDHEVMADDERGLKCAQRRRMLLQTIGISTAFLLDGTINPTSRNTLAAADDSEKTNGGSSGLVSASEVVDLLHQIPTFTIVDKKGVPFMVVGEDAKVTGYFFTAFDEAERILKLASDSADKAIAQAKKEEPLEDPGTNPWKTARISSVPLDTAVTLVMKSQAKALGSGTYFKIAPSSTDIEAALDASGKSELVEGRVPLFYYTDFEIVDKKGMERSPLYFSQTQLENDYRKYNNSGSNELPKLMVTELFSVLTEMVRPGGTDNDLKKLVFMEPRDSEKRKDQCNKKGGKEPPFVLGQRIIVL